MKEKIIQKIISSYLESNDFNGLSLGDLISFSGSELDQIEPVLLELIKDGQIGFLNDYFSENPHINRIGIPEKEILLEEVASRGWSGACFYPSRESLRSSVRVENYEGEPYKLLIALGSPQLSFKSFETSILEPYLNDPRYSYDFDGITGKISTKGEYHEENESDQILLEAVGFSFDKDRNRAVAVPLRYLSRLTKKHQLVWGNKELEGDYTLHPDYNKRMVLGSWDFDISIFDAFLMELNLINKMAKSLSRPNLFRKDHGEYAQGKPKKFAFMVRPTLAEYEGFILLLDKLISDNISKKFFQNEISETNEEEVGGKIHIHHKGTLTLLNEWIIERLGPLGDLEKWSTAIDTFKRIREMRQGPAHRINSDDFDESYYTQQREIIIEAYSAIKTLRLILSSDPRACDIDIPEHLRDGKITSL